MIAQVTNDVPFLDNDIVKPKIDRWLYTIVIMPFVTPMEAAICGEIELYIYNELMAGWKGLN